MEVFQRAKLYISALFETQCLLLFPPKPKEDWWPLAQSLTFSCPSPNIHSMNWDTPKWQKYFPGRELFPENQFSKTNLLLFLIFTEHLVPQDITHESYSMEAFLIYGETIHTDKWATAYLMF